MNYIFTSVSAVVVGIGLNIPFFETELVGEVTSFECRRHTTIESPGGKPISDTVICPEKVSSFLLKTDNGDYEITLTDPLRTDGNYDGTAATVRFNASVVNLALDAGIKAI